MNEIKEIQKQSGESYTYPLPGYFSYVENEVDDPHLLKSYDYIFDVCRNIVYNNNDALHFFIRNGIRTLIERVNHILHLHSSLNPHEHNYIGGIVTYWYNRQYFIQLTSIPKPINTNHYYTQPIKREPNAEIQMDILQLNSYFREINYNVRYLIVIVDVYSRFVWAQPVTNLKKASVTHAIEYALSRPGIAEEYYNFIKPLVKRVVYDGGSEFKKDFASADIPRIFNENTDAMVAPPKNQTFGRPTRTGPIEAAIAELRKIMRDYSLQISTNILGKNVKDAHEGLNRILDQYNQFGRNAILQHNSPTNVVLSLMGDKQSESILKQKQMEEGYNIHDSNIPQQLSMYNKHHAVQQQQLFRKEKVQYPIITNTNQGYGYRLFIPQGAFPKQVDIRVSSEIYYITTYNYARVHLKEFTKEKTKENIPWQSLVLVKTPIEYGPSIIEKHIKQEEKNDVKVIPRNIIQPYKVTPTIAQSVGYTDMSLSNEPTRKSSRTIKQREFFHNQIF
jgi:hypothetical protein